MPPKSYILSDHLNLSNCEQSLLIMGIVEYTRRMGTRYGLRAGGKCETSKQRKKIEENGPASKLCFHTLQHVHLLLAVNTY